MFGWLFSKDDGNAAAHHASRRDFLKKSAAATALVVTSGNAAGQVADTLASYAPASARSVAACARLCERALRSNFHVSAFRNIADRRVNDPDDILVKNDAVFARYLKRASKEYAQMLRSKMHEYNAARDAMMHFKGDDFTRLQAAISKDAVSPGLEAFAKEPWAYTSEEKMHEICDSLYKHLRENIASVDHVLEKHTPAQQKAGIAKLEGYFKDWLKSDRDFVLQEEAHKVLKEQLIRYRIAVTPRTMGDGYIVHLSLRHPVEINPHAPALHRQRAERQIIGDKKKLMGALIHATGENPTASNLDHPESWLVVHCTEQSETASLLSRVAEKSVTEKRSAAHQR